MSLPHTGVPAEQILAELHELRAGDLPTQGGRTLAYVYDSGRSDLEELGARAHAIASSTNGLDPTAFPSLARMENDVVAAAVDLLGGGPEAVGSVTSGGTESCLLAVYAARSANPSVTAPRLVLPSTAHAAFHKAARYFGVEPVVVPVNPASYTAEPDAMAAAIDERTILVVASAPSYPHGAIDPVGPIAAAAAERGVRCHVDACIGGWLLPYFRRIGVAVPEFDLSVPGVTSLSVDLHKYAYCPKGTSVLLHADAELRRSQYFASAAWPGYTMLNSTMQSTRSGGPIAAAWAVLRHVGDAGYLSLAERTLSAVTTLRIGISRIDGLRVLGDPVSSILAVSTVDGADFDVFTVADEMSERRWYVQPQFAFESSPANLHLTVTAANHGYEPDLLADLASSVAAASKRGPATVPAELAAAIAAIDPATLTSSQFAALLAGAGLTGAGLTGAALPVRMAGINAMLAVASPALRERLLIEFLNVLYR